MPAKTTALAYEQHGQGAPPFVFVHGWCCDRSFFAPQLEHFARTHRVVALDLRGCGESEAPAEGYDVEIGITVGAGHFNQLFAPEQVTPMIERFVRALLSTASGVTATTRGQLRPVGDLRPYV